MYIYPDNLKAKATLGLWELKDMSIIGMSAIISVISYSKTGFMLPIVITSVYAFLSIQFEGTSILDFIKNALSFFVLKQQEFEWKLIKGADEDE